MKGINNLARVGLVLLSMCAAGCTTVTTESGTQRTTTVTTSAPSTAATPSGLAVGNVRFSRVRKGPQVPGRFKPADDFYWELDITGFKRDPADVVWLAVDVEIVDAAGQTYVNDKDLQLVHDKIDKSSDLYIFRNHTVLPQKPPLGEWRAAVKVHDKIAGTTASFDTRFVVEESGSPDPGTGGK